MLLKITLELVANYYNGLQSVIKCQMLISKTDNKDAHGYFTVQLHNINKQMNMQLINRRIFIIKQNSYHHKLYSCIIL